MRYAEYFEIAPDLIEGPAFFEVQRIYEDEQDQVPRFNLWHDAFRMGTLKFENNQWHALPDCKMSREGAELFGAEIAKHYNWQ